jgi:hypothetical protein
MFHQIYPPTTNPQQNLKSKPQLIPIIEWTVKRKFNIKNTKNMMLHFSKEHQFTTKLNVNNTALLGTDKKQAYVGKEYKRTD